ncbi:hypothetical protein J7T55_007809 [Diaporthe amygdali]|uniref:uncharacterized protein n=1 Tax=Phomopsis amygdali TaxID=1214568 RepID=UPI0022FE3CD9|nr:uncharacterized protein J7T55_007809 [Diaporthe amygdali]KAJ0107618.1 hypothetical protein J7T55_007809 [Diaporthe amygdali]
METPAIAIIGGGPCGLTLARLLECQGIDYVVYERDESSTSNRAGGTLDIHAGTGQYALRECGLFDAFQKHARYEDVFFALADKHGKRVFEIGQGHDAPEIDRRELRQILLDSIPPGKIKWGHSLRGVKFGDDKELILEFANGTRLSGFKVIVGTDGAWSKVTAAHPRYSGKSYLESRIRLDSPLYEKTKRAMEHGTFVTVGSGKLSVTQRQGDGSYRNYFGFQVPEDFFSNDSFDVSDVEATRQLLLTKFYTDWSEDHKELVQHATDFRPWPLYTLSTEDMGWKSVGGITLAGDAAHLAITNGEGVNLALTDAVKLASSIAEHGLDNLSQAIQSYEEELSIRGTDTINKGKALAEVMFSDGPQALIDLMNSFVEEA